MKKLMRLHRYLGVFVAPAMLFFAVSGAWQAFRFQDNAKDGSYVAPAALQTLSAIHKAEKLSGSTATLFRTGQLLLALVFVTTAVLGLIMGYSIGRRLWLFWVCLAAGIVFPVLLAFAARAG